MPPTYTCTPTPIIHPQSGEWQGQTEDGFPISFTIVIQDEVTYLISYKIIIEFISNGGAKNRYTMRFEDFPLMDGQFIYRTESTVVSGVVNAPEEIEGVFTYQVPDVCEFKNTWKASPVNSE